MTIHQIDKASAPLCNSSIIFCCLQQEHSTSVVHPQLISN